MSRLRRGSRCAAGPRRRGGPHRSAGRVGLAGAAALALAVLPVSGAAAELSVVAAAGRPHGVIGTSDPAAEASTVEVSTRPARVETVLGDTVTVGSTVTNRGRAATGGLIAHLDVVSLRPDVYVDPEDWSAERSVEVEPLPHGASAELSWPVRAVDAGDFAVYVVLVPAGQAGRTPPAASPPVHLAVAGKRTLDAGGTLPVVLGVPGLLTLAAVAARLRRRRPPAAAGPDR